MSFISHEDVGENRRRVMISGRLDTSGTHSIASKLVELTAPPVMNVIVDLSGVKFLASIGIGALITSAKALKSRGGKLVLVVDAGSSVMMSLEATGMDQLIPVFKNNSEAERAAFA